MPQPTDADGTTSRRQVLTATTAAAAGLCLAAGSAGAASVEPAIHCEDPADEYTEYRCADTPCPIHSGGPYDYQSRHRVDYSGDGDYDCGEWESTGICCG